MLFKLNVLKKASIDIVCAYYLISTEKVEEGGKEAPGRVRNGARVDFELWNKYIFLEKCHNINANF